MSLYPKTEGILLNIMEEASEVIQIASKCMRFGMYNYNPNDPESLRNYKLLGQELGNLSYMIEMLVREHPDFEAFILQGEQDKKKRLEKYPLIITDVADRSKDGHFKFQEGRA